MQSYANAMESNTTDTVNAKVHATSNLLHTDEPSVQEELFRHQFNKRVIGQPDAERIALMAHSAIHNPLRDKARPIGIYFLIGPSRTGKSLTAEALAELLHGDKNALTRVQASDYMTEAQLLDLKGAPPMYIGYRDPQDPKNALTDTDLDPTSLISGHNLKRVRLGSQSAVDIVVIEEFEKGCADFYKLFMGIFDKGKLVLGNGVAVDFSNTIFVLTSNLGMAEMERMSSRKTIGFATTTTKASTPDVASVVNSAMRQHYPPEFRNRLDAVVVFQTLSAVSVVKIVEAEIAAVQQRINTLKPESVFVLQADSSTSRFLLEEATRDGGSVAELKRVVSKHLLDPLGRELSKGTIAGGDQIMVSHCADGATLTFRRMAATAIVTASQDAGKAAASFERDLQIAELANAEADVLKTHFLTIVGKSMDEVYQLASSLQDDLQHLFKLEVEHSEIKQQSHSATFVVKSASLMINLINSRHPRVSISR